MAATGVDTALSQAPSHDESLVTHAAADADLDPTQDTNADAPLPNQDHAAAVHDGTAAKDTNRPQRQTYERPSIHELMGGKREAPSQADLEARMERIKKQNQEILRKKLLADADEESSKDAEPVQAEGEEEVPARRKERSKSRERQKNAAQTAEAALRAERERNAERKRQVMMARAEKEGTVWHQVNIDDDQEFLRSRYGEAKNFRHARGANGQGSASFSQREFNQRPPRDGNYRNEGRHANRSNGGTNGRNRDEKGDWPALQSAPSEKRAVGPSPSRDHTSSGPSRDRARGNAKVVKEVPKPAAVHSPAKKESQPEDTHSLYSEEQLPLDLERVAARSEDGASSDEEDGSDASSDSDTSDESSDEEEDSSDEEEESGSEADDAEEEEVHAPETISVPT